MQLKTIKTSETALKLLRLIAAMTGEKQYEVMERLLLAEEKYVKDKQQ